MPEPPFIIPGQTGNREETGLVSWTVPWYVESLDDIFSVGYEPPLAGLIEVSRRWSQIEGAGVQVDITYEGYVGDDIENEPAQYEWDASFRQEKLNFHPDWLAIKEIYEGNYDAESGNITFSEVLSKENSKLSGNNQKKQKNPLFGIDDFYVFHTVFRITYISEDVPQDVLSAIGTIVEELPGGFATPTGRDWLVMPPKITERGGVYEVTEQLLLSPLGGGWPPQVYNLIEFN